MGFSHGSLVAFAAIALVLFYTDNLVGAAYSGGSTAIVVVGNVKCDGCSEQKLNERLALSGASVAIKCKTGKGEVATHGVGNVDENGSFRVELLSSALNQKGEIGSQCFARLVSGNEKLCSFVNTPSSNLVSQSSNVFTTSRQLTFSSSLCSAKAFALGKESVHKLPAKPKHEVLNPKPLPKQDGTTQTYHPRPHSPSVTPSTASQAKTFILAPPLKDVLPTGGPPVMPFPYPFVPIINTKYNP